MTKLRVVRVRVSCTDYNKSKDKTLNKQIITNVELVKFNDDTYRSLSNDTITSSKSIY